MTVKFINSYKLEYDGDIVILSNYDFEFFL